MAVMIDPHNDDQDPVASEVAGLSSQLGVLEVKVDGLNTKFDERFEQVDKQLGQIHTEMAAQRVELGAVQRTMIMAIVGTLGTFVTGFGILVGLIVAM